MNNNPASKLSLDNGHTIAYHKFTPSPTINSDKKTPGIIFLGGFKSDMQGSKAIFIEKFCMENNIDFLRFDYLGHGESSGEFTDFTIGDWAQNTIDVINKLTQGEQILIGSSLGGWLMMLATIAMPQRISALIGIASAPDFTENLMWEKLSDDEKNILKTQGIYTLPLECHNVNQEDFEPYTITYQLIEEARNHLLLEDSINIDCPIKLIHGMNDQDVPYQTSITISEKIKSNDVEIILQKNGDHRMSTPESLQTIKSVIKNLLL